MKVFSENQIICDLLSELAQEIPSLVLVDNIDSDTIVLSESVETKPKILISTKTDHENIDLLGVNNIPHLVGNDKNIREELKVTLQKIYTKNIWGIEKYLNEDAIIKSKVFHHSKEINDEIEQLIDSVDYSNFFNSPKDHLRLVLNELLLNSFFHQEDLENQDRKSSVFELSNSIEAKIGIDRDKVLISVQDNIGSIDKEKIISNIKRGFDEKRPKQDSPGAGLGLYLIYQNINQLIINKKCSEKSEFICVIEANKRYKKFKERVTSFHFFEEE